jgi:hypothetical protein
MLKNIFGLLFIVSLLSSCSDTRYKVLIDNPTAKKISVTIDKEVIVVDSLQSNEILLAFGDHTMKFGDSVFHFSVSQDLSHDRINLLINPTGSGYVLRQLNYRKNAPGLKAEPGSSRDLIPYDTIQLMDVAFVSGNYKKIASQFIYDLYDYGIDEQFPAEKEATDFREERKFVKIYREKDFLVDFMIKHKID